MPVTAGTKEREISQRDQYAKGGLGRRYWDYRDRVAFAQLLGPKVLDVGCGEGISLEKLTGMFGQAEGIDLDPVNVEICRREGLSARQASVYDLPYPTSEFDSCLFSEVIEHLERPELAFENLARVIRSGGRLVVVYPVDRAMFLARVICLRLREARFDPGHLHQWRAEEIRHLMRQTGFRPVLFRPLPAYWPLMLHGMVVGERYGVI
jgi:2-polyprenyl-3-methyl-5-hydroxy-6-metoxy-1,4-benzoquinol methylase